MMKNNLLRAQSYLLKNNWFLNYLYAQLLIHLIFITTFTSNISGQYELAIQIKNNNLSNQIYWNESPVFFLISNLLNIENLNQYLIFIYVTTQLIILMIAINLKFLENYSYLFFISGWLLTISWWMGYSDIFSVLLTLLIYKNRYAEAAKDKFLIFLFCVLLAFNHYAIALFVIINLNLLFRKKPKDFIYLTSSGFVLGYLILKLYLSLIGFNGETRINFLTRPGILEEIISNNSGRLLEIILSGFLGIFIYFIFILYYEDSKKTNIYLITLLISLLASSLSLDASRTFSIIIIPLVLEIISYLKEKVFFNNKKKNIFILISLFSIFFSKNLHVWEGSIYRESPFIEYAYVYDGLIFFINNYLKPLI